MNQFSNKKLTTIVQLLLLFVITQVSAQLRPSVLQIKGDNNYTTHFDTQTQLNFDLLQTGKQGEATLEFWAKAAKGAQVLEATYSPWILSNLLTGEKEFTVKISPKQVNVVVKGTTHTITLEGQNQLFNDTWHHFAISVNTNRQNLRVYIDGVERALFTITDFAPELLYMTTAPQDQLFVAEYRGWNEARNKQQIEELLYRSLFNETTTSLEGFYNEGLRIAYVNEQKEEAIFEYLPKLEGTSWANIMVSVNQEANTVANSFITSSYINGPQFAKVRTDADHPIYELEDILLKASKGDGIDDKIANNRNGIVLKWPHIKDAVGYRVLRKNTNESGVPLPIHTISDVSNTIVSEDVFYFDREILPNELYEYTVQVIKEGNVRGNSGKATGFVFPNGVLEGTVKTALEVATQNALLKAVPTTETLPGSAVTFNTQATPIIVEEVNDFRNTNSGSIEFWYKNTEVPTTTNTVFQLGNVAVKLNQQGVALWVNNTQHTIANHIEDTADYLTDWHHYAIVYDAASAKIYIDGGVLPTGAEKEVKPNASTNTPVNLVLNVDSFSLNTEVNQEYQLDEFRIWKSARTTNEIFNYAKHIIADASEQLSDLLVYYRLDIKDGNHIYNQAPNTRGRFIGKSEQSLTYLAANEQPAITYGTYTDSDGRYSFNSIHTGIQGEGAATNTFEYRVEPKKPNHTFMPSDRVVALQRVLQPRAEEASFTDVSALPISGRIVYRVANPLETKGYTDYPTLQGTGIVLDGTKVTSTSENSNVETNVDGVYAITASPGKHTFKVASQVVATDSDDTENSLDKRSLNFDGETGYAVSSKRIAVTATEAFSWTGFIKPDISADPNAQVPEKQTILHWGTLVVELRNNNRLHVILNGQDTTLSAEVDPNRPEYTFFGITLNPEENTLALMVNGNYNSDVVSGIAVNELAYLGVQKTEDIDNEYINFSQTNLDILEFRNKAYTQEQLNNVRRGRVEEDDAKHLKLSYTFEHVRGTRAVNMVTTTDIDNLYFQLEGGAEFAEASSGYRRDFDFKYRTLNETYGFEVPTDTYEFTVLEPISSLNFENLTRRTFIGNIVVPCNYGVGEWEGKITRTDIKFPKFEVAITDANFNLDRTVFMVNDLLPGQYQVELTNKNSGRLVKSSIIDLRSGNASFDFAYRNNVEVVTTLYNYTVEEAENNVALTEQELQDRLITPTCGDDGSIYNLVAGSSILVSVEIFENYDGNKCPVTSADVSISGDMLGQAMEIQSSDIGTANFVVPLGAPNFLGNHQRRLNVAVGHEGRSENTSEFAYLTGSLRGNSDFTLVNPTVGFVLFDPPGDGSSSTLQRGASYSFNSTIEGGGDVVSSFTATPAGVSTNTRMVTLSIAAPLGVGAAIGTSTEIVHASANPELSINASSTYRRTTGNNHSVTLQQSISTPSFDDYVGQDADVFIGTSQVLTFGTGQTLAVENCQPKLNSDKTIVTADQQTPFIFTRQQIEDEIIKDLQRLAIKKYDELNGTMPEDIAARNSLDLGGTLASFNIDIEAEDTDKTLGGYLYEIKEWQRIVKRKTRQEQETFFNDAPTFSETTEELSAQGSGTLGSSITQLDNEISFGFGTPISYDITRDVGSSEQNSGSVTTGLSGGFSTENKLFGVRFSLRTNLGVSFTVGGSDGSSSSNSRVDSFNLSDDDTGDQFHVRIRRHPDYDTPMFFTTSGQSICPFESGTVPRNGVEIVADKTEAYGVGDETILYNLTLRNTQIAADDTPKTYIVAMDGASNPLGAVVLLNESPIFEPATSSPIVFALDPSSSVGVKREVQAQLRIGRGTDAPSDISYENIKIRIYAACEQEGFNFASYRQDEYAEVGVVPFDEIEVTAHFTGACIEEVIADLPAEDWKVNNTSNDKLDFRFRIPEVANDTAPDGFTVDLEYAIPGSNSPTTLKTLTLSELKANLNADGYITYKADVASLTDGTYRFRVTPVCDDKGANLPSSRKNPTEYVEGIIARQAPTVVSTNPAAGGILTEGSISATFTAPINPASANSSAIYLRGILGGKPKELVSAAFNEVTDEVRIPHQNQFNISGAFTIEMWVNPARNPQGVNVPIFKKGDNFSVALTPTGHILTNNTVQSTAKLPSLTWTHVAVVYDGTSTIQTYFNGAPVGSGVFNGLEVNDEDMLIAANETSDSFVGLLDELRLWTEARSVLEITSNFNQQLIGNETNLLAYYTLDNNAPEGESGAPDEAIRDFTGRSSGTTETGLGFVIGEENAAPLDITKMVQELQFEIKTSDNNTVLNILPVFTDYELEGARLTAIIAPNKLEDPQENLIGGHSWDFVIDRNTVAWSQNNISVSQIQGTASQISSIDLVNENSAVDVDYNFVSLPAWISVKEGAKEKETNTIEAQTTNRDLVFEIAPYLNAGSHVANVNIETFNAETGVRLGVETFTINVNVACETPDYSFNSNAYFGKMNITGELFIKEAKSIDTRDMVVAYLDGTVRGVANVDTNGRVNLTVFGGFEDSGALSFTVWDASECEEYQGIKETYNFVLDDTKGDNTNPVSITVGERLSRRIILVPGYQNVSFNVRDNDESYNLSLSSVTGLTNGDVIFNRTNYSERSTVVNGALEGTITAFDTKKVYTIQSKSVGNKTLTISGVQVPVDTNVEISGSNVINAAPYYPNELQRTRYALRSLTSNSVSIGDRVENRDLYAEYTEEGWIGSLTHFTPGQGYVVKTKNDHVLNYTGIINDGTTEARAAVVAGVEASELNDSKRYIKNAADLGWEVNAHDYPTFMYVTGVLNSDLTDDNSKVLAAFVDGEVRGVAKPELIDGEYFYYMSIGGFGKEEISFKLFDGETIISLSNKEAFNETLILGTTQSPYEFARSSEASLDEVNTVEVNYELLQNIPNPVKESTVISYSVPNDTYVELALYNLVGQRIKTLVAKKVKAGWHHVNWKKEELPSGVYLYYLQVDGKLLQRKLIIE